MDKKAILLVALSAVIMLGFEAYLFGGPEEDAFIVFRYSEHLANHGELTWNLGEAHVEGYSSFTHIILNVIIIKLGLDLAVFNQLMGMAFSLMTLLLMYPAAKLLTKDETLAALPGLIMAFTLPMTRWAVGGLETAQAAFAIMLMAYLLMKDSRNATLSWRTVLAMLLVSLTRFEGIAIVGLTVLAYMAYFRKNTLRILRAIIPLVAAYGVYTLWRYLYFGHLISAPSMIKSVLLAGFSYTISYIVYITPFIAVFLAGFFLYEKKLSTEKFVLLSILASSVLISFNWVPITVTFFRPFIPVMAVVYLLAVPQGFSLNALKSWQSRLSAGLLVLLLVGAAMAGGFENLSINQSVKWHVDFVKYDMGQAVHGNIGRSLNSLAPLNYTIALMDAGMIPYYSDLRTIDYFGLNDYYIAEHSKNPAKIRDYLFEQMPEVIFTHPFSIKRTQISKSHEAYLQADDTLADIPLSNADFDGLVADSRFKDSYVLVKVAVTPKPVYVFPVRIYRSCHIYARNDVADVVRNALA